MNVYKINQKEAYGWLLQRHYAKRLCPISFAFGGFEGTTMIGVVTYGVPVASTLREGICGKAWSDKVLELNRLCCVNKPNVASSLVGRSLKMLPKPSIVVSFADTSVGHVGYVYQACNFLYTGLSAKRTDWKIRGMEKLHGATIADISRGQDNRADWMRSRFGDDFYLEDRPRKHRYVYFVGSVRQRKEFRNALRYEVEPYPKGQTSLAAPNTPIFTQSVML